MKGCARRKVLKEEEKDDWVLLKKIGQKFGRNTWKRS